MPKIRILIADDHPIVVDGLRAVLSTQPDFEVVSTANNGEEALHKVNLFHPDVLLLDLEMPRVDGVETLRRLAASWWEDEHRLPFRGVTAFLVRLAILLALHGQYTEALLILDRAFILLAATGEHFWEAELHRWRGKVLQRLGEPVAEVDACFRKALLIARHQQAKFQELCALMSLCLLWWGTEKYHDVAQQLAALYADFQPNSTPEALTALLTLFERFM